ncbi:hypothetical protein ACFP1I_24020 [Dyadobacter subterraneus]|uniref:Uncharacterized protein n=1 Tax=Dyadobacter subterraneus TaxID=2773304 RepID=A0ABR9WLU3_9BACT|nr:hypothetical protein [Dyadobacter subterraneus]MBE9466485.1 hypothetical protein [Dyadobacter subterraneus]
MAKYNLPRFDLTLDGDDNVVWSFLESLDGFFENLVYEPFNFADWVGRQRIGDLTAKMFREAWEESKDALRRVWDLYRDSQYKNTIIAKLESVGFTSYSLKAKANLLNTLSDKLRDFIDTFYNYELPDNGLFSLLHSFKRFGSTIYTEFIKLFKDLLDYLNALLGSLAKYLKCWIL